jgi:molybdate transport system regulatory protein
MTPTKLSARNVFEGRITALHPGPFNTEVVLQLPGGEALVAVVTQASAQTLGLAVGGMAKAVVKAPWVVLATGGQALRFSARNQLAGTVDSVSAGPVNAEVAVRLSGGTLLHAVVTDDAVADLGLKPGEPVQAIIKASHVMLAV